MDFEARVASFELLFMSLFDMCLCDVAIVYILPWAITELNHHVCIFRFTAVSLHVVALERHPWILMLELNDHV